MLSFLAPVPIIRAGSMEKKRLYRPRLDYDIIHGVYNKIFVFVGQERMTYL